MVFRPVLRTQLAVDIGTALLLGGVVAVLWAQGGEGPWSLVTTGVLTLALALRRVAPGLALGIAWIGAVLQMVTLQTTNVADLFIPGVIYTTSVYGTRRIRIAGLVSAIVGAVVAGVFYGFQIYGVRGIGGEETLKGAVQYGAMWFVVVLAVLLLPWLAGLAVRARRSARMSREAQLLAERDAARADRNVAIEQERVRIARDMHDIVAHSLAVVIAQADGARYALRADPAVADEALDAIGATARRALGDVRELLGALRHEQGTAPTPDVDDIERLVGQMRDVGLDVQVEREGDPSTLPTTTQLAVYRIVQESLTNAYKHGAPGSTVRARLTYRPDTVEIDVVNRRTEDDRPGPGTGHGLVGMRERATMSGGSMTAGPRGEDFAVAVRMPAQPSTGQMPRNTIPTH